MTTYECWEDDCGCTFAPRENIPQIRAACPEEYCKTLLYTIEAETWEEAMTEHHKKQGWQPYIPMDML